MEGGQEKKSYLQETKPLSFIYIIYVKQPENNKLHH